MGILAIPTKDGCDRQHYALLAEGNFSGRFLVSLGLADPTSIKRNRSRHRPTIKCRFHIAAHVLVHASIGVDQNHIT